jgi:glucose/arabinose dehydrogenase
VSRRRSTPLAAVRLAAVAALLAGAPLACSDGSDDGDGTASDTAAVGTRVVVTDAARPVSPVAEQDGGLLYAERVNGAVRRTGSDGRILPEPVATVDVVAADDDQRGLLGLARLDDGRLFASWTAADDGRLVVGEVTGGGAGRLVWSGPVSADAANGGHLVVLADGRLAIGVGDLLEPERVEDPAAANGKVLALAPDGPPDQQPTVLSSGWNNPFAMAVDAAGVPWVADNVPGEGPERLGRADRPAAEATDLPGPLVAPAGLVWTSAGQPAVCGYLSGELRAYSLRPGEAVPGDVLARPCRTGAAVLPDGRFVLTTDDQVLVTG